MEKMITINVPEGYEIDKEKSTFEQIVFTKKDAKPRSWGEYCKSNNTLHKYYISEGSKIASCGDNFWTMHETLDRNLIGSEEEAEAFMVLMQLRLLRKAWVGDWEPDYDDCNLKYLIYVFRDIIDIETKYETRRTLSFPTREMAEEFLKCFSDLIEKAKVLL